MTYLTLLNSVELELQVISESIFVLHLYSVLELGHQNKIEVIVMLFYFSLR